MKNLAGVDRAMECGIVGAEVIHEALCKGDLSEAALAPYQDRLTNSFVIQDSYKNRYFRWAFMENPRLLGEYLPDLRNIDRTSPWMGMLKIGIKHPFGAPRTVSDPGSD